MVQDIRHSANLNISVNTTKKYRKYPMHTNENIAIGLLKDSMIAIFLERSRRKREKLILILQQEIEMYLLPIRKLPCHERKKNLMIFSNKNVGFLISRMYLQIRKRNYYSLFF